MNNISNKLATSTCVLLGCVLAQNAAAESFYQQRAVSSCVEAVNERLDLDDATRVRHVVNVAREIGISKVLTINTSVFAAERQKSYEAYCVSTGYGEPLKFRFKEDVS